MTSRQQGETQKTSAACAGFSERTGRTLEKGRYIKDTRPHNWITRHDPFAQVWENELKLMLQEKPGLTPITLLEYLQTNYPDQYSDKCLRTLERRVKAWKAINGSEKEVMFRQTHEPGRLGLSDFTTLKNVVITIRGKRLIHLLYHFRLACSGWSHLKVILGGESFTALAEGMQEALWRLGGAPFFHRTDSLSAAFKNTTADETTDQTTRYEQLCAYYHIQPTRNNRGKGHENGSVESPHGHIKRRIQQALILRDSSDFESLEAYQAFIDEVVNQHNRRNAKEVGLERSHLQALPTAKTVDYTELCVRVSSSSTIDVRRATYTVPSRLEGESLRIHLFHNRLECFLGTTHVVVLVRVYSPGKNSRARNIDYRHIIHSLVKKPQAFRFSQLRDDLLPNDAYKTIWRYVDQNMPGKAACKFMVGCLFLAAQHDCEAALSRVVLNAIEQKKPLSLTALQQQFACQRQTVPSIVVTQHPLTTYDALLHNPQERAHA